MATASQMEEQARSMRMRKLIELLEELQRQRWCSHIIKVETFDEGISAIAHILQHAGTRICLEICKCLLPIIDACQALKPEDEYYK